MFGIGHLDIAPMVYGGVIFCGLWSMYRKLVNLHLVSFVIEAGVFILVFKLHGGSMSGGFAAAIAAILAGLFFGPRFK